ncbi:DUF4123 domain-containing protein [Photorhabdus khanii]|uniref:DUF4123 domain-containing protein n=1 Tax=Photorhabdus khanii TaxID=1004150 RepID=A0A7C9KFZ5_9GAMM|nr:DUF4123 domain-containing protein [Photorhabdus khanii]MQL48484.1 DUF4123 domain-containing protein [Photorhabdus khanii]
MNNVQITDWLTSLETSVKATNRPYLDVIVDQSGTKLPLIPALQSFQSEFEWCSLFRGLPEEMAADAAPILMRIDLTQPDQRLWMQEVILHFGGQSLLLVFCSLWSFEHLSRYLIQCVDATYSGKAGILRFFNPHIFPVLLSHVLDEEQQQKFLRPALFWSWLDRDGVLRSILGKGDPESAHGIIEKINLTDKQLERLSCVSDAHLLVLGLNRNEYPGATLEQLFSNCYVLMLEASDAHILLDDDRESFVLARLKSRLSQE